MEQAGLPEPTQRLAPAARTFWRTTGLLWSGALLIIALGITGPLSDWDDRPGFVVPLLWGLVLLAAIVLVVLVPELRWRRWRYEIRAEEIDIRRGTWAIRRTLVPMARVQHVDTESRLIQQLFELATVSFHTAAGKIEIPQLTTSRAGMVRDRIAELSRTAELDV
jgi:uncharacterized protein